jgi:hypothetical protein
MSYNRKKVKKIVFFKDTTPQLESVGDEHRQRPTSSKRTPDQQQQQKSQCWTTTTKTTTD